VHCLVHLLVGGHEAWDAGGGDGGMSCLAPLAQFLAGDMSRQTGGFSPGGMMVALIASPCLQLA